MMLAPAPLMATVLLFAESPRATRRNRQAFLCECVVEIAETAALLLFCQAARVPGVLLHVSSVFSSWHACVP